MNTNQTAPHVVTRGFPLNVAGQQLTVWIAVDLYAIAHELGPKAARNKSRKSKLKIGIECRVLP